MSQSPDWPLLFDWTNRTIGAGDPEYQEPGKTPEETAMAAMTELFGYFAKLVEEKRKLQRDPGLLDSAVEEVIRYTSPIIHFGRTATVDFPLRDKLIREGDALALFYPSANRDEEVFEDGDAFRIDRNPNHHLGFGVGEHFCLGSHVARLELAVAYRHLLPRIEEIEVSGPIQRLASALVSGVKRLPIRYKLAVQARERDKLKS